MKHLIECCCECPPDTNFATPSNTIGMGNVDIENGSDGSLFFKNKKKKKHKLKSLKDKIKEKLKNK